MLIDGVLQLLDIDKLLWLLEFINNFKGFILSLILAQNIGTISLQLQSV